MEKESNHICLCPLEGIINLIAKKWAILIISIISHHKKIRFNDIQQRLDGISPKALTDVLKDLHNENLIHLLHFPQSRSSGPLDKSETRNHPGDRNFPYG